MENAAVSLFALMTRFVRSVAVAGGAELREFGLSPAQYQVLVCLETEPGLAQRELVRRFGVTKGNISQLVKKLEDSGLVERTRAGRTAGLVLSGSGRELVGRVTPAHDDFMDRHFRALDATERRQLEALLTRLTA